jgi:hypothetical protein
VRKHQAPRLYSLFHAAAAFALVFYHEGGALPLTFSGPNGVSHIMVASAMLGTFIGIRSGWPRNKPPKHDPVHAAIQIAKALGLDELDQMHQAKGRRRS